MREFQKIRPFMQHEALQNQHFSQVFNGRIKKKNLSLT